ncbi:MAG: hypothetical protein HRT35_05605 [Algicola sp.]|nr:hypothetical protein [Algicola sp.]
MEFGLICEGPTDQAVLENMLCGLCDDEDLYELITELQPGGKSDTNKDGGWERVLEYLASYKFRQAFTTVNNVVIQIDTDVAHLQGFDVDLRDEKGKTIKSVPEIVAKVKARLVEQIESGEKGFFTKYDKRIIFAITVHSLEIWLFKHYNKDHDKAKLINGGEKQLALELLKDKKLTEYTQRTKGKVVVMVKNYDSYCDLSMPFYESKTCKPSIENLLKRDESFKLFKGYIDQIKTM